MEKFTITITVTEADMRAAADEYNAALHPDEVIELGVTWEALEGELSLCSYTEFVTSGAANPEDPAEYLQFLADNCI
jgi:hypothetical protein